MGCAPLVWGPRPSVNGPPVSFPLEQELGSHCCQQVRPVSSACWTPAGLSFVHIEFLCVAEGRREFGLGSAGFHPCFFAVDVVLLESSNWDLHHVLWRFAA